MLFPAITDGRTRCKPVEPARQLADCMAVGGILLEYGALSPDEGPLPQFAVLGKSLTLKGYLYTEIVSDDAILSRAKTFINEGLRSGLSIL